MLPLKFSPAALFLLTLAACTQTASAYEKNDVILRAGAAMVTPDVGNGTGLAGLDVDSDTQLGLTGTWMLHPHFGIELLAATPFEHDITLGGSKIGSTRHLPPTLTLQWYPLSSATIQPYIGAGINHTIFFDTDNNLGVNLDLGNSTGLALEAGVDMKISENLYINAAVWKIDINTDVSINGTGQGELEIDPFAGMLGLGYRF